MYIVLSYIVSSVLLSLFHLDYDIRFQENLSQSYTEEVNHDTELDLDGENVDFVGINNYKIVKNDLPQKTVFADSNQDIDVKTVDFLEEYEELILFDDFDLEYWEDLDDFLENS